MDCGQERGRVRGISRGNTPPSFQMKKSVLYPVTQLVEVLVKGALVFVVFPRGTIGIAPWDST